MKKSYLNLLFILIIVALSIWQGRFMFSPGLFTFSDEAHIANLHQMTAALESGQFPPRWAPNFSYNYGHPFFNFYYILPYFIGSLFNMLLGYSLINSLKIVFMITIIGSGLAMYLLASKFFNKTISLSVSIIYLFTPYRAVDLYVRGAIGEMMGFLFMPLVLYFFISLIQTNKLKYYTLSALSLFGLIISHNLTVLLFFPMLLFILSVYIVKNQRSKQKILSIKKIFFSTILSVSLSAFYLIPAFLEKKYMQTGTPFNPIDHFPFIKQLIIPYWGYGASVWGPTDELSFQIGIVNLLIVGTVALIALFTKYKYKALSIGLLITFFVSVYMMNIRSLPLWNIIPISSYVQFPWRFLILTTFTTSLLAGFIGLSKNKLLKYFPIILAIISIIITKSYFKPHTILKVDDNYYLNRFFINQNTDNNLSLLSNTYHLNSEDYLPLTIWTSKRPNGLPQDIDTNPNTTIEKYKAVSAVNYMFTINSDSKTQVNFNRYYFPGWQVKINGSLTTIKPTGDYGVISFNVPPGESNVQVYFADTPIRKISNYVSLIALMFVLTIPVFSKNESKA